MIALNNLSLKAKLFIIPLIPLLVLAYLLYDRISGEFEKRESSLRLKDEFARIEAVSSLLHELQLERGMMFGFLVGQRKEYETQLSQQRRDTDMAIRHFADLHAQETTRRLLLLQLDSIPLYREKQLEYLDFLNKVKSNLLTEIYASSRFPDNAIIQNDLNIHVRLIQAKELLALIRSNTEPNVIKGEFSGTSYPIFASLVGQFYQSVNRFKEGANAELREAYIRKTTTPQNEKTFTFINELFNDASKIKAISEDEWWSSTTHSIDLLKQVEDYSLNLIKDAVNIQLTISKRSVLVSSIAGVLLSVLIGTIVLFTIKQITGSLNQIKRAAERISQGEISFEVDEKGKDEISSLARSFNQMIVVNRQYVEIADTIGKGDYSPSINLRSNDDILGKALINMKDNLHNLSVENENRTWLLTGNSLINNALQGDKTLETLSYDILHKTVSYLNASVGTIYVRHNGALELKATYAFSSTPEKLSVKAGDGLVGQTARDGQMIVLENVPPDYIQVSSSLGSAKPQNLIVFPFNYEGTVTGVMEIGLFHRISGLHKQFLETISNNIAVAVHAAQSREQLKLLLEETQRQSEELVSQQEELSIANEELQQKTELLERSEEELRAQQEELQQTNEELYAKAVILETQKRETEIAKNLVEEKARELEITNRYKSDFLANMSHELRTPLNSILILSQVLIENRNNHLTPKEIQFANTIYNSGSDLMELINEVLDLSKIEAGKMELEIESFPLRDLGDDLEHAFSELAKQKSIRFIVEIEQALFDHNISSDRQRVEQILKNFLSNAFKFTDEGGAVKLSISRSSSTQRLQNRALSGKTLLEFSVSDTGIGIPPDKLVSIFEAFEQVDGSTKRKYGGTGLGLSISKELTKLLGGEIHVDSKVGEGSTFTLFLPETYEGPAATAPPSVRIAVPIADSGNGSSAAAITGVPPITEQDRKILIVEKDPEFGKVLMETVEERNYKGILAQHGVIGLNYVRHYKPDAIILGTDLPGMNEIEILRHLKKDPQLRHIPVQVITRDIEKAALTDLGAFDVLRKPLSRDDFSRILDRIEDFASRKLKRLLIVEDDKIHNEAIQELIGNGDVKCYPAYSAQEAFALLGKESFDCIIVDLGLPDINGFDFLEKIKLDEDLRKIPVIVYTGKPLSREETTRLEKISSAIVLKTAFSPERLLDETTLFLHRVESQLPREKQSIIRKLHKTDEILKGRKVLIVDDDVRNVYSLVAAFEQEGLICITAENGKIALEKLKQNPDIDIAMMDVMMPEMDGYEATREIRKIKDFVNLPIIALTAKAMKGDREKCLAAGMSDYVSKPINVQQLLSLMRVWLYV